MSAYHLIHGGDIYTAMESGCTRPLDFSANIGPLGLPPAVAAAAKEAIEDCTAYPDPLCRQLTGALAQAEGVPARQIICGNGAAELLFRFAYALRPQKALLLAPGFAEYEQALAAAGCEITYQFLQREQKFFPTASLLEAIQPDIDVVMLCNPHNPTGVLMEPDFCRAVADRCRDTGTWLLMDECFLELTDTPGRHTVKPLLESHERLFILKAFTKLYAMPGLRLGYGLCADSKLLERMAVCGQPWSVSVPAQAAGIQALKETAYVEQTRMLVKEERAFLLEGLRQLPLETFVGTANFLFFRAPGIQDLHQQLEKQGILIRSCGNYRGLTLEYYRVAVRTREDNRRLLAALGTVLGERMES